MKFYPFNLLLLILLSLFATTLSAQTITIGNIDNTLQYSPGSSIAVPITVSGCVPADTKYTLYISNNQNFTTKQNIGHFDSFYATFVNGTIPNTGPFSGIGTHYLRIEATSASASIAPSGYVQFTMVAGAAVIAGLGSDNIVPINNNYPDVLGFCAPKTNYNCHFDNSASTTGATVTANFHDEYVPNGTPDASVNVSPNINFVANITNYTIFVKAAIGGITGTHAYMLVNNATNTTFGTTGTTIACKQTVLNFNVDVGDNQGLQHNFPGNIYTINWGDGSSQQVTFCDLQSGTLGHKYMNSSCGSVVDMQNNVFKVTFTNINPYCGVIGSVNTTVSIFSPPTSVIDNTTPNVVCAGTVSFNNKSSYPGEDPNAPNGDCRPNAAAKYDWTIINTVDNNIVTSGIKVYQTAFTASLQPGSYRVTLHYDDSNPASTCSVADATFDFCVQETPHPASQLNTPASVCLASNSSTTVNVTNTTPAVTTNCSFTNQFRWTLKKGTGNSASIVTTVDNVVSPSFSLSAPDNYSITLTVFDACGEPLPQEPVQTITVNGPPVVTLNQAASFCGPQQLTFDNTVNSPTRVTYSGTASGTPTTYSWSVTPNNGGTATFPNPADVNNKYPTINFQTPGSYTVSVTYGNATCVTSQTVSETIIIQQAPEVHADPNLTENVCPLTPSFTFNASISDLTNVLSKKWTRKIGNVIDQAGISDPTTLNPTYTFSQSDAGKTIRFTLDVKTNLVNGCDDVQSYVDIIVSPLATGNNGGEAICDGAPLNHTLSSNPNIPYTWTATSTTVNGYTQNGSSTSIQENSLMLVNNNAVGTITYTITPYNSNGCPGTPFTYTVTVNPLPPQMPAITISTPICSGNPTGINLPAGYGYKWAVSPPSGIGNAQSQNIVQTSSNGGTVPITDALTNNTNAAVMVTYVVTPYSTSGCPGPAFNAQVTVNPTPTQADADNLSANNTEEICNQPTFQLNGNTPTIGTGMWTLTQGTGVTFDDPTNPAATASSLIPGNTYKFTWTISYNGCNPTSSTVTVTDYAPAVGGTAFMSGNNTTATICQNGTIDIALSNNTGTVLYWETSADESIWSQIPNTAGLTTYAYSSTTAGIQYLRAEVQNGPCPPPVASSDVAVTTLAGLSNNHLDDYSGETHLCYGTAPSSLITGSAPIGGGGNGSYTYQWQQSIDGGSTYSDINGATGIDYQPGILTQTTSFRRVASSATCNGNTSLTSDNAITITVAQAIIADFTVNGHQSGCAPFTIHSGDVTVDQTDPGNTYIWYANGVQIPGGNSSTFPGYVINGDNQTVSIKLTVKNALGCEESTAKDFSTTPNITAGFTMSAGPLNAGCADQGTHKLTVNFTNTSTPAVGGFTWYFGDNSPSYHQANSTDPVSHDFAPSNDGSDKTYYITLTPDGCTTAPTPFQQQLTVYPASPVAIIDPGSSTNCAPYDLTVINKSPGTNKQYDFYLTDQSDHSITHLTTDNPNTPTSFHLNPIVTTQYSLYMVATNMCGVTSTTNTYSLTVYPSIVTAHLSISPSDSVNGNIIGCAPFQTSFHNLSTGGENYTYRIYDSNLTLIDHIDVDNANTSDPDYLFATSGTYYVSVVVSVPGGSCAAGIESDKIPVTVIAPPTPAFSADVTLGCSSQAVNFTNNTADAPGAPANSYTYHWDYGDGTAGDDVVGTSGTAHTYTYQNTPYTVTLTATNANGCVGQQTISNYITVSPPPGTDFDVLPGTIINIPDYHFSFVDRSAVTPASWHWNFGDKTTSTERNPEHMYADTGKYKVTLITVTAAGCTDSIMHVVQITGVPGQLYVPNAFMPNSLTDELRVFTVKGSGIKKWDMQVFNSWGQLIFETTKLGSKGEPLEFWNGKYKGLDVPQGGYAWQISATFINGTEWKGMSYKGSAPKRAGIVNLIR